MSISDKGNLTKDSGRNGRKSREEYSENIREALGANRLEGLDVGSRDDNGGNTNDSDGGMEMC